MFPQQLARRCSSRGRLEASLALLLFLASAIPTGYGQGKAASAEDAKRPKYRFPEIMVIVYACSLELLDRKSAEWRPLDLDQSGAQRVLRLRLAPGDGELLRLREGQ